MEEKEKVDFKTLRSKEYGENLRNKYGDRSFEYLNWYHTYGKPQTLYDIDSVQEIFIKEFGFDDGMKNLAMANSLYFAAQNLTVSNHEFPNDPVVGGYRYSPVVAEIIKQYPKAAAFVASMYDTRINSVKDEFKVLGGNNVQFASLAVRHHIDYVKTGVRDPKLIIEDEREM